MSRVLCWFSCGAASAVAAKITLRTRPDAEVIYCDTLAYEHPDNWRFIKDCERWLGKEIKIIRSKKYSDIFDVFEKTRFLVGPNGARCTVELKKRVRYEYQLPDDWHVFGFTAEEGDRIERLKASEVATFWFPLAMHGITKGECHNIIRNAGIEQPAMYRLGYRNNNCIGCVKGGMGYWNKIRRDFPESFARMAKMERKLDVAILKDVFLDELSPEADDGQLELDLDCGVLCPTEAK